MNKIKEEIKFCENSIEAQAISIMEEYENNIIKDLAKLKYKIELESYVIDRLYDFLNLCDSICVQDLLSDKYGKINEEFKASCSNKKHCKQCLSELLNIIYK